MSAPSVGLPQVDVRINNQNIISFFFYFYFFGCTIRGILIYWIVISVPEVTLDDMPLVQIFVRYLGDLEPGSWYEHIPMGKVTYDEGTINILYKSWQGGFYQRWNYYLPTGGEYRIVVVK
jgi:hypothetical protein